MDKRFLITLLYLIMLVILFKFIMFLSLQLRLTSLQAQEEKIARLKKETDEAKKKSPSFMSFAVEVDQFCKEWDDMATKLGLKNIH